MSLSNDLRGRLLFAAASLESGRELRDFLDTVEAYSVQHTTHFFNVPVDKDIDTAPIPGTPDAAAMAWFGAVHVERDLVIQAAHLHQVKDGTGGAHALELFHYDNSTLTWTLLATVSLSAGGGDFSTNPFTFVSESAKSVAGGAGMYLYLQATGLMTSASKPRGFVDVHWVASGPFAIS